MKWLSRLAQRVETGKVPRGEPPKPTEGGFGGFGTRYTGTSENSTPAHLAAREETAWHGLFLRHFAACRYGRGLSHARASEIALTACIARWMDANRGPALPDRCAWCGGTRTPNFELLPFGNEGWGHVWLHARCWQQWYVRRCGLARAALQQVGLPAEHV